VRTPLSVHRGITRGWIVVASLASTAALLSLGGSATAVPQPTIAQVEHELSVINNKTARLGQDYDAVTQQLTLARQRLHLLKRETRRYRAAFAQLSRQIDRIAIVAYEQGSITSPLALLTSKSVQQVLDQSSILSELSEVDSAQIRQYLAASHQLLSAELAASRTELGISQLVRSLGKRLEALKALQTQEVTLLAKLSPVARAKVAPGGGTSGKGGKKPPYKGPTGSQADAAVQFAYNQIGCPYVYGATGPCTYGYDCSGLMMAAWGHAGVAIPRVSYDQMADLPPVSLHTSSGAFTTEYLQPGDILGFAGNSHVGMYVGDDELIDAPVPGAVVEKVALAGWYLENLDGAVRP
jgi:peptidoglycan DL-endopeptidase CwlO